MSKCLLLALALVVVCFGAGVESVNVFTPVSFCQRFATQTVGAATSQSEISVVSALVSRFLFGNSTETATGLPVQGLFAMPEQAPYFDGSLVPGGPNYLVPGQAQTDLVDHLNSYFQFALGCRDISTPQPSFRPNMAAVHSGLLIPKTAWNQFVDAFLGVVLSFGWPSPARLEVSDLSYLSALMGQYKRGGGICEGLGCDAATGYAQFTSGSVGTEAADFRWFSGFVPVNATDTVTVAPGSNVHFDFGRSHSVVETDANYNVLPNGFTSGPTGSIQTYTVNVGSAETTRYFICGAPAHVNMKGKIVVQSPTTSAATPLTTTTTTVLVTTLVLALASFNLVS